MELSTLIPLVGQLLTLGFKIADIIDKAENVSPEDKEALKAQIKTAQDGVTFWKADTVDGPVSEDKPVPSND
jgi:hypothetical protein